LQLAQQELSLSEPSEAKVIRCKPNPKAISDVYLEGMRGEDSLGAALLLISTIKRTTTKFSK
jgi:hypothetical protein